ncbi:hypothetical protein [Arenicella xantha]|uniref:Uncharacterized protein n=1 Tax=Arenicella xantha TaxID=644221 RepID=A0A395JHL9_9GAMM|nr:hypothetical protein [Arenicella xantha]RBP47015.1 hypothetical protein DFR28_1139 [Arenicella xantha]
MESCPLIQTIAVFSFGIGIVIHSVIFFTIKRFISPEYLESLELEKNKFKSIVLDMPGIIPSKNLSVTGRIMKWIALVSLIAFVSSAFYIAHLKGNNKLCAKTSYSYTWSNN